MRIGIDCGITGAIALISGTEVLDCWDMPTYTYSVGKGKKAKNRRNIDGYALYMLLSDIKKLAGSSPLDIIIEAQQQNIGAKQKNKEGQYEMRPDSAMTAFKVGEGYGTIKTAIEVAFGSRDAYTIVYPVSWKRKAGLFGSDKSASITHCVEHFDTKNFLTRKKDHNRADAICIAYYGIDQENF